jgi:hypothetical protein
MASETDICNLALAHLGDTAAVASISPPDGSVQAQLCARFYAIARDSLLESHTWGFATRRASPALLGDALPEWAYAYAQPAGVLSVIAILPPGSSDDYSITPGVPYATGGTYVPQAFSCEVDANGNNVVYTDQADALMRFTAIVTDTSKFTPLFTLALSWHLAGMLAGPMLKGDAGAAEAKRCAQVAQAYLASATESDAGQRRVSATHNVGWMTGR